MKRFFIQIFLFTILLLLSFLWVFTRVDGYSDQYYLRFTTPKQSSLIIGVSKSAQGVQPQIINKTLKRKDMFNYSFNAFISPFGRTYFESIKRKLDENTKNGVFIITFDAWSLGSMTDDPNDSTNFREINLCLSNSFVSLNPNVPYLLNYYEHKYVDIFRISQKQILLHKNGWLEVNVDMDSLSKANRLDRSVKHYNKIYVPFWKYSSTRLEYLSKFIKFLKEHGKVYLVRLPVHKRLLDLENKIIPDLNKKIKGLSNYYNVPYLDFSDLSDNYEFTDGIHLWKESGEQISKEIAEWILKQQNNN